MSKGEGPGALGTQWQCIGGDQETLDWFREKINSEWNIWKGTHLVMQIRKALLAGSSPNLICYRFSRDLIFVIMFVTS